MYNTRKVHFNSVSKENARHLVIICHVLRANNLLLVAVRNIAHVYK